MRAPPGLDVGAYIGWLSEEHGLLIAGAFDELAGKAFRVGHMGAAAEPAVLERYLTATREYLG